MCCVAGHWGGWHVAECGLEVRVSSCAESSSGGWVPSTLILCRIPSLTVDSCLCSDFPSGLELLAGRILFLVLGLIPSSGS